MIPENAENPNDSTCHQRGKRIFDKVYFIYSKMFNQSVTFDYESKLIQYIVADELYQVTNKNSGIADKQYFEKQKYDERFEMLWRKLQREKLVKHSIEEIENSDLFKYSPYKELNNSQREAVEEILTKVKDGTVNRVVVNGMPGSGKTIVAVYLMKYLADSEEYKKKQIGFVVPQTSLRKTMKMIFKVSTDYHQSRFCRHLMLRRKSMISCWLMKCTGCTNIRIFLIWELSNKIVKD